MTDPSVGHCRDGRCPTCHPGWNACAPGRPLGGLAVAVRPGKGQIEQASKDCGDHLPDEAASRPARWAPQWLEALQQAAAHAVAGSRLPGSWFPALPVPRFVHGQSQGICDLFGAFVERQDDGNYFVHPLRPDPAGVDAVEPRAIEDSMYWGAVEWICYARSACRGRFAFRNPVMTGPFDTANYLLGTTVLMEWVYAEPATVHRLLVKITGAVIAMLGALRQAAGGVLHGDALSCVRNAFCLCSECRSIVSAPTYEEFEAPYLARIGAELGPYGIHSCGNWERTVTISMRDPQLRAMNGQVRENNLAELCALARGNVILSIGPSEHLGRRYTWPDTKSFLEYVLATAPPGQPLEVAISESDLGLWNDLCATIRGPCAPPPGTAC